MRIARPRLKIDIAGCVGNSPVFHSPVGTAEMSNAQIIFRISVPANKLAGYSQMSLRDKKSAFPRRAWECRTGFKPVLQGGDAERGNEIPVLYDIMISSYIFISHQ